MNINDLDKIGIIGKTTACDGIVVESRKNFSQKENIIKRIYRLGDYYIQSPIKDKFLKYLQLRKFNKNYNKCKVNYTKQLKKILGLKEENKIEFIDHHDSHAYGAYYGLAQKDGLVFSLDGQGDFSCARVYKVENDNWELLANTWWKYSIGELYSKVTKIMGMKPLEHEYKVMGLAAYSDKKYYETAKKEIFEDLFEVRGLEFFSKVPSHMFEKYLKDKILYHRFDNIAGALQATLEEKVLE